MIGQAASSNTPYQNLRHNYSPIRLRFGDRPDITGIARPSARDFQSGSANSSKLHF